MTCRSHPWTYPAENGHSSHDHSASLHCLLSGWSERLSRGEPWHLVRAAYYSRYPNGEGKRDFTDRTKAPRVARTAVLKGNMRLSVGGSSQWSATAFPHTNRTCDIFSNPPHEGEHCKRTVR